MPVQFHQLEPVTLKDRTKLKAFIPQLFQREGKALADLNVIFCSDDYLLEVNKQFLNHDYYTDIITFDLSEPNSKATTAELYISIDRIKDNAVIHEVSVSKELHRVIFHGCLHLCGYKDKSKRDIEVMRGKEEEWIKKYFK
jgi:probable rRNA maturation factor